MKTRKKPSRNGKLSNNPADYAGQWVAWDSTRKKIIATDKDITKVKARLTTLGEVDSEIELIPRMLSKRQLNALKPGESKNIMDDLRATIPQIEEWLDEPNEHLLWRKPRDLIGTSDEHFVRDIIRWIRGGIYT